MATKFILITCFCQFANYSIITKLLLHSFWECPLPQRFFKYVPLTVAIGCSTDLKNERNIFNERSNRRPKDAS